MFDFKKALLHWLPVVLWCFLIFFLSSLPTMETSQIYWWDFILKKTAHVVEYGVLFFLVFRALNGFKVKSPRPRRGEAEGGQKSFLRRGFHLRQSYGGQVGGQAKLNMIIPFLFCIFYALTDEYHQSFVPGRTATIRDIGFDTFGALIAFYKLRKKESYKHFSSSVKETHEVAEKILKEIKSNVICLYGDLGSGKTTFVQGLAKALGIKGRVISPSFVLVRSYQLPAISYQQLIHIDCYRLESEKDFKAMDLSELWSEPRNLVVIEWAEKVKNVLPKKRLDVYFKYLDENKRELRIVNC